MPYSPPPPIPRPDLQVYDGQEQPRLSVLRGVLQRHKDSLRDVDGADSMISVACMQLLLDLSQRVFSGASASATPDGLLLLGDLMEEVGTIVIRMVRHIDAVEQGQVVTAAGARCLQVGIAHHENCCGCYRAVLCCSS